MRIKSIIAIALVFSCVACSNNGILENASNTKDNARPFAGKTIKAGFRNFTTGCCAGVVGNKEFNITL